MTCQVESPGTESDRSGAEKEVGSAGAGEGRSGEEAELDRLGSEEARGEEPRGPGGPARPPTEPGSAVREGERGNRAVNVKTYHINMLFFWRSVEFFCKMNHVRLLHRRAG